MVRTRITTTNNASSPKVVWLGSGIIWYAYIKPPNETLFIRRSVAGVLDPEFEITHPVPKVDVTKDPGVADQGWIYFIHDGSVQKILVTQLAASFNSVAYLRQDGWYQSVPSSMNTGVQRTWTATEFLPTKTIRSDTFFDGTAGAPGVGLQRTWDASEGPDAPSIVFEKTTVNLHLVITLPNRLTFRNRNITLLNVYKYTSAVLGWELQQQVAVPPIPSPMDPPSPLLQALIPDSPVMLWKVTCVRTGYLASEGFPSNILTNDGLIPIIYLEEPVAGFNTGIHQTFGTTDMTPNKTLVSSPVVDQPFSEGNGAFGTGIFKSWVVNGFDIINP